MSSTKIKKGMKVRFQTGKTWKSGKNIGKPMYAVGAIKRIDGAYIYVQRGSNKKWIYEVYENELKGLR